MNLFRVQPSPTPPTTTPPPRTTPISINKFIQSFLTFFPTTGPISRPYIQADSSAHRHLEDRESKGETYRIFTFFQSQLLSMFPRVPPRKDGPPLSQLPNDQQLDNQPEPIPPLFLPCLSPLASKRTIQFSKRDQTPTHQPLEFDREVIFPSSSRDRELFCQGRSDAKTTQFEMVFDSFPSRWSSTD